MIARLLHICNTNPWCLNHDKETFYALKQRLLEKHGVPDGYDVQKIEGKPCWSCDGSGTFYHYSGPPEMCFKCYGSGWFKHPVWVTLKRYRFGRYVFHTPEDRSYQKPDPDVTNIIGYVRHADYSWRTVQWAAISLTLLCERRFFWPLLWDELRRIWIVRVSLRRCIDCERHTWSTGWRCRPCERLREKGLLAEELPF